MSDSLHYQKALDEKSVRTWMQYWKNKGPQAGVVALVAETDLHFAVPLLQRSAREVAIPLIGAVFPELIVDGQFCREGMLLVGMNPMPEYRLIDKLSNTDSTDRVVQSVADLVDNGNGTLMMVFDSMFGNTASLLDEIYFNVGDACGYAGVCAGSETFTPMPCIFDESRWVTDALLAFVLPVDDGAILVNNYQVTDTGLIATASSDNRITKINLSPAFDKYAELVFEHYGERVTKENFYSMGVHFPFALVRADGEFLIRIPVAFDADSAIFCVGEVPEGSMLGIARAIEKGNFESASRLAERYQAINSARGVFFYCAGRRLHLGQEDAQKELSRIKALIPDTPLHGALSLGEIGTAAGGYPLFQNATIVGLPLESDS